MRSLVSHVQGLAILGSLPLEWPRSVRELLAIVGLDALRIPAVSCLFASDHESSNGLAHVGGSPQGWTYPLAVCGGALGLLLGLSALEVACRLRGADDAADSAEAGVVHVVG